jgi:polyphenol oxidase
MFYIEEKKSLKYYKSSILEDNNLVHAFTTRFDKNPSSPLNGFSLGTAGNPELKPRVDVNRKRICNVLGLNHNLIINPQQEHTDNIKIIKSLTDDLSSTDGVITDVPGLVLLLLFADCVPVIIYAPEERVVGVIHAGWKGTAKGIVAKAVNIFNTNFNISSESIKVAIGPAIGQCCYPVSGEVAEKLKKTVNTDCDNIFKADSDNLVRVDLKGLNARQLEESGIVDIDILDDCTSCKNSLFYSYRAEKGKTGRHGAIASLCG